MRSAGVVATLTSQEAIEHLKFGLGRRLLMIRRSYMEIMEALSIETSMTEREQTNLDIYINTFYLHVAGSLDNLAWCLAYETQLLGKADEKNKAFQRDVALFGKKYQKAVHAVDTKLGDVLDQHHEWVDQAANGHRVPGPCSVAFCGDQAQTQGPVPRRPVG